jgi:hypothetical protein
MPAILAAQQPPLYCYIHSYFHLHLKAKLSLGINLKFLDRYTGIRYNGYLLNPGFKYGHKKF